MTNTISSDLPLSHETQRLAALQAYSILTTPPEAAFDNLTQMMAQVFKTPIAFIAFVDEQTVFYKARVGEITNDQLPLLDQLCIQTIQSSGVTLIEAGTPALSLPEGLAFYAGAPLITAQGYQLGTASIVDTEARPFSADDQQLLMRFARLVMEALDHRLTTRQLSLVQQTRPDSERHPGMNTAQLTSVFLQVPVAIGLLKGPDHVFEIANARLCELLGKSADALVGKPLLDALPTIVSQYVKANLDIVSQTGEPLTGTEIPTTILRGDQPETRYYNYVYEPLSELNDELYILFVATDVTAQVVARQEIEESESRYRQLATDLETRVRERTQALEEVNTDLRLSNENLRQFAQVASHDLQEPLRKIQTFSDILQNQFEDNLADGERDMANRIQKSAKRMQMLIKDLLTYSQVAAQRNPPEPVALNEVVRDVINDLEIAIAEQKATIRVSQLPTIWGSSSRLRQLMQNLLANALKFRQADRAPVIQVDARLARPDERPAGLPATAPFWLITVADNGLGFDEKYKDRIFYPFQRLHDVSTYSGTGIGLAICQRVVESYGGAIDVSSQPGEGSIFKVYLPRYEPDANPESA